jgi:hypothetical protein
MLQGLSPSRNEKKSLTSQLSFLTHQYPFGESQTTGSGAASERKDITASEYGQD